MTIRGLLTRRGKDSRKGGGNLPLRLRYDRFALASSLNVDSHISASEQKRVATLPIERVPMPRLFFVILAVLAASAATLPADELTVSAPPPDAKVPSFYSKYLSANGYPIVASPTVNDYALKEAGYLVNQMLAHRPDVRQAMIASGSRLCIIGYNEFTTDLPEFAKLGAPRGFGNLPAKDYWDARARGTGGSTTDPYCSCGEENLLGYPGDPYAAECILIHEFAHNIHLRGMATVDPKFDERVKATYDKAMSAGLWKGKYAAVNHHEYFAEGVQSWFDDNRENDHDHNHVNTREELLEYDPGLAALCREVFGETKLTYSKPATRLTRHLAGYDPQLAPEFVWPERLKTAHDVIRRQAVERSENGKSHATRQIEGWTVHIDKKLLNEQPQETRIALELLTKQLQEIVRVVPAKPVAELKKVPLWFSPKYPNVGERAEYHPGAGWLKNNGRNPEMAKAVEFTNIAKFEAETRRMPNFTLHELAHAYHDRVLNFEHRDIKAAYERAKASGTYDRVDRKDSEGRVRKDRSYALTNQMEYFAEGTEAFFAKNDFYPFNREELEQHDPEFFKLLKVIWEQP